MACVSQYLRIFSSFSIFLVCVCARVCVVCACMIMNMSFCRWDDNIMKKRNLAEEKADLRLLWCRQEIEKNVHLSKRKLTTALLIHSAGNVQVRDLYIGIYTFPIVQDLYIHTPRQKRERIQMSSAPCYRSGYRQEYWLLTIWQDLGPSNSFRRLH